MARHWLRAERLSKSFGANRVLDEVDLTVAPGSIRALVGENGSGKSTLVKIIAGVLQGDPGGSIEIAGHCIQSDAVTPDLARRLGVRVVHQNLGLFPQLTVLENIALVAGYHTWGGGIQWSEQRRAAEATIRRFNLTLDVDSPVGALTAAERTMIAIARALEDVPADDHAVLILDEPTAALPEREVDDLLAALELHRAAGHAIVYVTHRIDEVLSLANTVTVLRNGRVTGDCDVREIDAATLVRMIVGREVEPTAERPETAHRQPALLEARGLQGNVVRGATLAVAGGEVVGFAGVSGSGASEILRLIFGAEPRSGGTVTIDGVPVPPNPADAMRAGIAFVPADRAAEGIFGGLSVRENVSIASLDRYSSGIRIRRRHEAATTTGLLDRFDIRPRDPDRSVESLSGGNQQKVSLARWLCREPRVLLLDEPTQGVDVGARAEIHGLIRAAVAAGGCAVIASSDHEELARLVDRILVIARGRIWGGLDGPLDAEAITRDVYAAESAVER